MSPPRISADRYLSEDASSGLDAHNVARRSAEAGSERLLNMLERLFEKFERTHGLPKGHGEKLQLGGYRA